MLSYLRIRGLALLDDVTLELAPGMNVLTGETGAGKSIIVDALALLRGARAKTSALRTGAEALQVDAQFELGGEIAGRVRPILSAHGLPSEHPTLVVQRTVPRSGRGRCLSSLRSTGSFFGSLRSRFTGLAGQPGCFLGAFGSIR